MEYEVFVWNAVLVISLLWVLLYHFSLLWSIKLCVLRLTTVIIQAPHALIVCKCVDNLFYRKSFWTLDFNWEAFMQPTWAKYLGQRRKELFPVTLNNSGPLDWKNYTCEWNQEHEHRLWWNACQPAVFPVPDLTLKNMLILDHEQHDLVYEGNFEGHFADKINWMYTFHMIYALSYFLHWIYIY